MTPDKNIKCYTCKTVFDFNRYAQCPGCGHCPTLANIQSEDVDKVVGDKEPNPHYNMGDIECIDAIHAALGDKSFHDWCRGNAMKYIWRSKHKGTYTEDMKKAIFYCQMAIDDDPREYKKDEG